MSAWDEIRARRFDHQMKMRFHEAIGMDLPVGFGAGLGQGLHKGTPVNIVVKHRGFAIATAHDMVNGALILDPKFSRHEESIIDFGKAVDPEILIPRSAP